MKVVAWFGALLIALCGCSQPQRTLGHRLKEADRVIITNTLEHLGTSITGADVETVAQAVATSKKVRGGGAFPVIELHFYKGPALLATIATTGAEFYIEKGPRAKAYIFTNDLMTELLFRIKLDNALPAQ